jgi:gluconokinase
VRVVLLMGVAGAGKTTIGHRLAAALGWAFHDADTFHPPENIRKMAAGQPLDDTDRHPWLLAIRQRIDQHLAEPTPAIFTCSALKASYRDILLEGTTGVELVYLKGTEALLRERLEQRQGHFLPPELLHSQLETLEPPHGALEVDIAKSPARIVRKILRRLGLGRG